jgi:hypothetical protein
LPSENTIRLRLQWLVYHRAGSGVGILTTKQLPIMKKLIIILTAVALFAACSKKQDTKPVVTLTVQNATAKDLAGNWSLVADTEATTTNGKTTIVVATNTDGINFQFNADGTGIETVSSVAVNFTYTVADGLILLHAPAQGNSSAQDATLTITAITTTRLTFKAGDSNEMQTLVFVKN